MCLEWATILFACENEKRVVFKVQNKDECNLPNFRAHDALSLSPIVCWGLLRMSRYNDYSIVQCSSRVRYPLWALHKSYCCIVHDKEKTESSLGLDSCAKYCTVCGASLISTIYTVIQV